MSNTLNSLPGHAYAPGFEPNFWDAIDAYFSGSTLPVEAIAALICAFAAAVVLAGRARMGAKKRRKRGPILPEINLAPKGRSTLSPRGKRRDKDMRHYWGDDAA